MKHVSLLRSVSYFGLLCFFTGCLFAQPAVTRDDLWVAGETIAFIGIEAEGVDPGPAGNGVTWRFADLVRDQSGDSTFEYLNPDGIPGADRFPEANIVAQTEFQPVGFSRLFAKVTQDEILDYGQTTPQGTITYTNPVRFLAFPFSYNQVLTDDFLGEVESNVNGVMVSGTRRGTVREHYDGFGTLILNGRTFEGVRRLKQVLTVTDSLNANGATFEATGITTSYTWLARESRTAVFQLSFVEVTANGVTSRQASGNYQDIFPGQEPALATRYGPHLTNQGGNFDTQVIIANPGDSQEILQLQPLASNGQPLAAIRLDLAPGDVRRELQNTLFPADASGFSTSGCNACQFTLGYRAKLQNASTAHVHQTTSLKNRYYFYPGEWQLLFDGAAIVNAGDQPAKIEASQIADSGELLQKITLVDALEPGAKFLDVFNSKFSDQPDSIISLQSNQPLAVMILRISSDNRYLYQNLSLPDNPSGTRWLAHITGDGGGFKSTLLFHNRSTTEKRLVLTPYDSEGNALGDQTVTVPGNQVMRKEKSSIVPPTTSHIAISGASECVVSVGYQAVLENASTAQIHETKPIGNRFTIFPGEWDVLFDGLAIINTGDTPTAITATQLSDQGQVLGTAVLSAELAPGAKFLGVLEGVFEQNSNSSIRIEATQPMAILALRLSKDSRYLYGNQPLP